VRDPETTRPGRAKALGLFAMATAMAVAGAAAIVGVVLEGDFLTGAAEAIHRVMFAHGALAAAAAASPLVAVLLVGYAYMMKGLKRRAAQKAAGGTTAR